MFKPGDVVKTRDGRRFITVAGRPYAAAVREVRDGRVYLVDGRWTTGESLVLVKSNSVAEGCIPFPPKRDKNKCNKKSAYYALYGGD